MPNGDLKSESFVLLKHTPDDLPLFFFFFLPRFTFCQSLFILLFVLQEHGSRAAFYRTPTGPPVPRSPISAMPPCYPEWGVAVTCGTCTQPGVGQRTLHEPPAAALSQPPAGTPVPAGDPPGEVTREAAPATIRNSGESPWRRRSSFEPLVLEPPLSLDDADLPVSQV